jgi:lipopolysaccharide biosynthesis glycosyltransferase
MEAHVNRLNEGVAGAISCADLSDFMPWDEMKTPHQAKFYIWRYVGDSIERIIWLDTDTFMRRALTEDELPDVPFAAVEDVWQKVGLVGHKRKLLDHDRCVFKTYQQYFNSGVMVCRRDATEVFDLAFATRNKMFKRSKFWDQDHFNYSVWTKLGDGERSTGWHALDKKYNVQEPYKPCHDTVVLHFPGPASGHRRLEDYYEGKHL